MAQALDVVRGIYAAFGRGDVASIMAALSDDVAWDRQADDDALAAQVVRSGPGAGKAAVAEFFGVVGRMTMHEFRVRDLLASDRQVAAEVVIDVTVPSGRRYREEGLHVWTVDEGGRVTRMRHYVDRARAV